MPDETTTEPDGKSKQDYYIVSIKDKGRQHFLVCEPVISIDITDDADRDMVAAIERYMDTHLVTATRVPPGFLVSIFRSGGPHIAIRSLEGPEETGSQ